jgi:hypothetical protein
MSAPESSTRGNVGNRELAFRESGGVQVSLFWHAGNDELTVEVEDARAGQRFESPVDRCRALDAFYHPFAYVA